MNKFKWADLSTFDVHKAKGFYSKVFGWKYQSEDWYVFCSNRNQQVSGLYEMPEKFRQINMPSFWMSYIEVENLNEIVQKAESLGAKIEVRSEPFGRDGQVALIRDPSGAGFTIYQGRSLPDKDLEGSHGSVFSNELYVSNISLVKEFYEKLFGWKIKREADNENRYSIKSSKGEEIAFIEEMANEIKGNKEFWAIYFAVDNLDQSKETIADNGGNVVASYSVEEAKVVVATDPFGATFFLTQSR